MTEQYSIQDSSRSRKDWQTRPNPSRGERQREDYYSPEHQRGLIERAGDELRSWFGDEEAERRRLIDERYQRQHTIARSHDRFGDVRARDLMTSNVITVHPWDTVERAAYLMDKCDCGSLPVVSENGHLIAIITDRDIAIRSAARGKYPRRVHVDECMSGDIVACHEYDAIENCMRQLARHQLRRLPIVDDHNQLVGIVSQADLAWHAGTHTGWGERRAIADMLCAVSEPTHIPRR